MAWRIEFEDAVLDKAVAKRITAFLRERIAGLDDPRSIGEVLKGSKLGAFWKYRVGDWRIITHIEDEVVRILVVRVGHRKEVYRWDRAKSQDEP